MSKKVQVDPHTAALRATLGPRLRAARKAMGMTQEDAAELIGISSEFFARMERGNALPSVETLKKLSEKLHVTVDHLLGTDEVHLSIAEESKLLASRDPKQLTYIVDRARGDTALTRVLLALLRLCATRFADEEADDASGPLLPADQTTEFGLADDL